MSAEQTISERIEAVLRDHRSYHSSAGWNGSPDPSDWHNIEPTCTCNERIAARTNDAHRAHVAAALLAAGILQEVEAAWDEGWNAAVDSDGYPGDHNPYRADSIVQGRRDGGGT